MSGRKVFLLWGGAACRVITIGGDIASSSKLLKEEDITDAGEGFTRGVGTKPETIAEDDAVRLHARF